MIIGRVAFPSADIRLPGPVPVENRICLLACGFVVASGGSAVFVDQPVQYGFSADSLDIEVDCCDAGSFALMAGNLLGDTLMQPVLWGSGRCRAC